MKHYWSFLLTRVIGFKIFPLENHSFTLSIAFYSFHQKCKNLRKLQHIDWVTFWLKVSLNTLEEKRRRDSQLDVSQTTSTAGSWAATWPSVSGHWITHGKGTRLDCPFRAYTDIKPASFRGGFCTTTHQALCRLPPTYTCWQPRTGGASEPFHRKA